MIRTDELRARLETVVAVPVTPFDDAGKLDERAYGRLIETVVKSGIAVLTPGGNTGEFYSLSEAEQRYIFELTIHSAPQALIIPAVGADVGTAIELATYAGGLGATAIMVHQPVHPYQTEDGWLDYHRTIARNVEDLGLVLYVKDKRVSYRVLATLLDACPNIVGVKYAVPDLVRFAQLVRTLEDRPVTWLCGLAESWAPFFWVGGARGFTSGLVNVVADYSLELLARLQAGEYEQAMKIWSHVMTFEELRDRHETGNNVAVVKEALAQQGRCERYVRAPSSALSHDERREVAIILAGWGLPEITVA